MFLVILANLTAISFSTYILAHYMTRAVPMEHPGMFKTMFIVLQVPVWGINNYLITPGIAQLDILILFLSISLSGIFAKKGFRVKGCIYMLAFLAAQILENYLLNLVVFPAAKALGIPPEYLVDKRDYGNAIMGGLCALTLFVLDPAVLRLMNWLWSNPGKLKNLLLVAPVPLSQMVSLNIINRYLLEVDQTMGISLPLHIAAGLSVAADICAVVSIRKLQSAAQTEAQLQTAEQQLNVQTDYHRQLQENILAVNQIRHDLNNQLTAAYRLLDEGQNEQVRRQLDLLRTSIREKVGPRYCGNLIVDAVLDEKARQCRENHIELSPDAQLPPQLPIENAHLCSAFSNLLDNSIQGASNSGAAEKTIELRAAVQKDCLVIRCRNTAAAPEKKDRSDPLRSHGLGLGILNRLAKQYDGSFQTEYSDGWFTSTLILHLPKTKGTSE